MKLRIELGVMTFLLNLTIFSTFSLICFAVQARDISSECGHVLTVDRPAMPMSELHYPNDDNVYPKESDFSIISYVLLSSCLGERRAIITFKNNSSGQRFLTNEHVLAVFANGERKDPGPLKEKFNGYEKITINLNFGVNNYPILGVITSVTSQN